MKKLYKVLNKMISVLNNIAPNMYMRLKVFILSKLGVYFNEQPSYIDPSAYIDTGSEKARVFIGKHTVISRNVTILVHDFSATRALEAINRRKHITAVFEDVKIGDNCFIGASALILPGTIIGNNVIVGGGAVVKGQIEDGIVIVGNPAYKLKTTEEYAQKFIDIQ